MASKPYILVIDPGLKMPELDCFNAMSRRASLPMTYHLPGLFGGASLPDSTDALAGIIILGSGASVHDDPEWQQILVEWLRPRLEAAVPVLGLCYGHQLIAHIFGGQVSLLWDGDKAKGMREVSLQKNRLWGDATRGLFVVSHREGVTQCPDEFETVGSSVQVACDVIAHNRFPIWGFQPHIEATEQFLVNNSVPGPTSMDALASGHRLVGHFLDYCANTASTQAERAANASTTA